MACKSSTTQKSVQTKPSSTATKTTTSTTTSTATLTTPTTKITPSPSKQSENKKIIPSPSKQSENKLSKVETAKFFDTSDLMQTIQESRKYVIGTACRNYFPTNSSCKASNETYIHESSLISKKYKVKNKALKYFLFENDF